MGSARNIPSNHRRNTKEGGGNLKTSRMGGSCPHQKHAVPHGPLWALHHWDVTTGGGGADLTERTGHGKSWANENAGRGDWDMGLRQRFGATVEIQRQ